MRSPLRVFGRWYLVRDGNDPAQWTPAQREWFRVSVERLKFLEELNLRQGGTNEHRPEPADADAGSAATGSAAAYLAGFRAFADAYRAGTAGAARSGGRNADG